MLSGGGCCIVGSPVQQSHGIADDPELALADWANRGGGGADLDWADRYLRASRVEVYDWLEELGVVWEPRLVWQAGNTVPRWHKPRGGGGAVMAALRSELDRLGGRGSVRVNATARRLVGGGSNVVGVEVESGGSTEVLSARATIVATGGFVSNRAMLAEHGAQYGPLPNLLSGSGPSTLGRGHRLLAEVGAHFSNMSLIWFYPVGTPDPVDPTGCRGLMVRGIRDEVWVNAEGRRFCDEHQRGHSEGGSALLNQPGQFSWGIVDTAGIQGLVLANNGYYGDSENTIPSRRLDFLTESPHVRRADSIEDLAHAIGVAPATLVCTMTSYNHAIAAGLPADPETGKDLRGARPISQPPYTAIRYRPLAQKNLGGVLTDLHCAVLTADSTPVPGLYAAGEVAGMAGGHINGASGLEGTMFGPCLYSGRVAGASALGKAVR
jgi:predicted oxidoreductase